MKKIPPRFHVIIFLIVVIMFPLSICADDEYYPGDVIHLPRAIDIEVSSVIHPAPDVTYRNITVWTINGPLKIHIIQAETDRDELTLRAVRDKGIISSIPDLWNRQKAVAGFISDVLPEGKITEDNYREKFAGAPLILQNENPVNSSKKLRSPANVPIQISGIGFRDGGEETVMITVEGNRPEISAGMTPRQLGEYFQFLDCEQAFVTSTGSSSLIFGRYPGMSKPETFNEATGAGEKVNGALIIELAPSQEECDRIIVKPEELRVLPDIPCSIEIHPVDRWNNPAEKEEETKFKIKPEELGRMDGHDFVASGKEDKGKITVYAGGEKEKIPVRVFKDIQSISSEPDSVALFPGETLAMDITAHAADGQSVPVPAVAVQWKVPENAGKFIAPGKFEAGNRRIEGVLAARVHGVITEIPLAIGKKSKNICDFRSLSGWEFRAEPPLTSGSFEINIAEIEGRPVSVGWLTYQFPGNSEKAMARALKTIPIPGRPEKIRLNVMGNHGEEKLSVLVQDGLDRNHFITLTDKIDWKGWKYLEAFLPQDLRYPVSFAGLAAESTDPEKRKGGNLQFHSLEALYPPESKPGPGDVTPENSFPEWLELARTPEEEEDPEFRFFAFGNSLLSRESPEDAGSVVTNMIIKGINKIGGDIAIHSGNLTRDSRAINFEFARNKLKKLEPHHLCAIGQTDIIGDPEVFNFPAMVNATHLKKEMDEVCIFLMDNVKGGFKASDDHQKPAEEQWPWLLEKIGESNAKNLIFVCHLPPVQFTGGESTDTMNKYESEIFHRLLVRERKKGKRVMVISGSASGFGLRIIDGIPYFLTGGAGAPVKRDPGLGGVRHFLQFDIRDDRIYFRVRPVFTRLAVQWSPLKREVGVGESLEFSGSGILIVPDMRIKDVIPLLDYFTYKWTTEDSDIGEIGDRNGIFRALEPGYTGVKLETGLESFEQGVRVLKPGN